MQKIKTLIPKNYPRTFKQSEFARLVAEEGMTSSEAYRIAYNPSKNATQKSIHEMACRVFANVKVQSRIREVQRQIDKDNRMRAVRREEYVLKKLTEEAELGESANSRIRALELLGKTVSMFNDKSEDKNSRFFRSSEEIKEELKIKLEKLANSNQNIIE